MKHLYIKNCKILKKETEENTNKWKDNLCSQIGRINIAKISILPEVIYNFNIIYQNSNGIFHRNRKNYPKICIRPQKSLNSQSNLKSKRTKLEASHFLISKSTKLQKSIYYGLAIKTDIQYGLMEQSREPGNKSSFNCQLIF